jgi:hypothetical protein
LCLGALADCILTGHFVPRVLAYPGFGLLLLPARYWIPPDGQDYPAIRSLPRQSRHLVLWCALSLLGVLCVVPFVAGARSYWPAWALGSCAHLAVTLWLARRVVHALRSSRDAKASSRCEERW